LSVEKLKLKDKHTWKSRRGFSICVIDRGLVRFDYPSNWIVEPGEGAVHLHDRPPSVESCDLGVSIFRMPPEMVQELALDDMLVKSLGTDRKGYEQSEIRHLEGDDLEIAWLEQRLPTPSTSGMRGFAWPSRVGQHYASFR
jgi:hypothetical protein